MYRDEAGNHQLIATRTDNLPGYCEHLEWAIIKAANRGALSYSLIAFRSGVHRVLRNPSSVLGYSMLLGSKFDANDRTGSRMARLEGSRSH